MTPKQFKAHSRKVRALEALQARPGTDGEKQAAEAALDRVEPGWRLSDEELLKELGAL